MIINNIIVTVMEELERNDIITELGVDKDIDNFVKLLTSKDIDTVYYYLDENQYCKLEKVYSNIKITKEKEE